MAQEIQASGIHDNHTEENQIEKQTQKMLLQKGRSNIFEGGGEKILKRVVLTMSTTHNPNPIPP